MNCISLSTTMPLYLVGFWICKGRGEELSQSLEESTASSTTECRDLDRGPRFYSRRRLRSCRRSTPPSSCNRRRRRTKPKPNQQQEGALERTPGRRRRTQQERRILQEIKLDTTDGSIAARIILLLQAKISTWQQGQIFRSHFFFLSFTMNDKFQHLNFLPRRLQVQGCRVSQAKIISFATRDKQGVCVRVWAVSRPSLSLDYEELSARRRN